MAAIAYYPVTQLPWSLTAEESRRFRKILWVCLTIFVVASIIVPWLPSHKEQQTVVSVIPQQAAVLKLTQPKPIPPPPIIKPVELPKPVPPPVAPKPKEPPPPPKAPEPPKPVVEKPVPPKPKPVVKEPPKVVDRVEQAREKASKSGLLALTDQLADMRQRVDTTSIASTATIASADTNAAPESDQGVERALLGATSKTSGGINAASIGRGLTTSANGSGKLGSRNTTRISGQEGNKISGGSGATASSNSANGAQRGSEEIRQTFDRNKAAIYSIYNRALRDDPTLKGKIVLELVIESNGRVSSCRLISSELHNPELERKLLARIQLFDFGARAVGRTKINYPIDFLPS